MGCDFNAAETGGGLGGWRRQPQRDEGIVQQTTEDIRLTAVGRILLRQRVRVYALEEDAIAAAHRGLAVSEYVPGKTQPRSEVVQDRRIKPFCDSFITWIHDAGGCVG